MAQEADMLNQSRFFKTEQEARAFQKELGFGALYKNTKGSRTKREYFAEAIMADKMVDFVREHPYVVAWYGK